MSRRAFGRYSVIQPHKFDSLREVSRQFTRYYREIRGRSAIDRYYNTDLDHKPGARRLITIKQGPDWDQIDPTIRTVGERTVLLFPSRGGFDCPCRPFHQTHRLEVFGASG